LDNCVVAVIGDLMLDSYLQGEVERVSPEAPVPVLRRSSERQVPGGAANVACNLMALGVAVRVVGVTGRDDARTALIKALHEHGRVVSDGIVEDPARATIQKMRLVGGRHQIARIDTESTGPLSTSIESAVVAAIVPAIRASSVVVASDYGKGVLSDTVLPEVLRLANQMNKPVLVDPGRRDWSIYRGASILTPNRRELTDATGLPCETDEQAEAAVARARQMCSADILLTRSEKGMSFYRNGKRALHIPAVAHEVFDVSGAGDTVIAVLAAGLALDMDIADALKMANHAAGIVVAKFGTATITRGELLSALFPLESAGAYFDGGLVSPEKAAALRHEWARQGLAVGVTNGCFDLIHPGHIAMLRQAAASCDRLIVALNSDASVKRLKGDLRPVQDEASRAEVIGAIKGVSAVTLFEEDTPLELLKQLTPDVLVKGADYTEDQVVGAEPVRARGGRVVLVDLVPEGCTTMLIERSEYVSQHLMLSEKYR
jgi:D-beta-D-heptose 7-phosphate kinase/D-beta-D-heptose 1-phosphate adenosyltransferase